MRGFPVEVSPEAAAVHQAALVIDLHNDVLTKLTHMPRYDFSRAHAPATFYNPLRLDLDLPRIRRGGIDALGCLMFAGFRFDKSRNRFWRQLACARRYVFFPIRTRCRAAVAIWLRLVTPTPVQHRWLRSVS